MQRFVDDVTIEIRSGHGGAGAVSFRRERYVPRGGPDGGDGGRGGDVLVRVKHNLKTLAHFAGRTRISAEDGAQGQGRKRHGRDGQNCVLEVAPGTTISDAETGELLLDTADSDEEVVLLRGGRGGKGNTHFKSSTHQAPRFSQPGEPGEQRTLHIELRLIADVGFVGLPNAGKSSLLQALTAAHPKIGDYPFTTRVPNLGVLRFYDHDVVLADIPGIIEGAADGAGLGHQFLRHISRTAVLALLIDVTDPDPAATYQTLLHELNAYDTELARKRRIVIGSKCDLDPDGRLLSQVRAACPSERVIGVSSAARLGLQDLTRAIGVLVTPQSQQDGQSPEVPMPRRAPQTPGADRGSGADEY